MPAKKRFQKIMVANRGEIAIRILRSARELGYQTLSVYSEDDIHSLHRYSADESILIGPAEARLSYLHIDRLIEAAKKMKADAIHPGYGFLSENANFAKAAVDAGLVWIGPSSECIHKMGDKIVARATVQAANVPTLPGTGALEDPATALKTVVALLQSRKDFKFPLLIKSAAGGGGKGMRIVRKESELKESLERAQSEALKAFGDSRVFVERYLDQSRHIEVQVLGDTAGVVHLYERECSLQRRHQKVVEEALSPSLSDRVRPKLYEAAVQAAKAANYQSAGTIEFIVSEEDEFYFLEMNTRIQVEHPVTEWITGVDIAAEQIRIADSGRASISESPKARGHSIEVRIYAEDPLNQYLPQPGRLKELYFPAWSGIRVDTGVKTNDRVSSFYDPMIAKVSSFAASRDDSLQKLLLYLKSMRIEGLITNRVFLAKLLESDYFAQGRYHTQLLDQSNPLQWSEPTDETLAELCLQDYLASSKTSSSDSKSETSNQLSAWQQNALAS